MSNTPTGFTTVQVSRESSRLIEEAASATGMRKYEIAEMAIRFFFDAEKNPDIAEAFKSMGAAREKTINTVLNRIGKGKSDG